MGRWLSQATTPRDDDTSAENPTTSRAANRTNEQTPELKPTFFAGLMAMGIAFSVEAGRLRIDGPVSDEARALLLAHETELVETLNRLSRLRDEAHDEAIRAKGPRWP